MNIRGISKATGLAIAIVLTVAACRGSTDQEDAKAHTSDFMKAYYQHDDLELAVDFTAGAARTRVQSELDAVKDSGTSPESRGPGILIEMGSQSEVSSAQIIEWSVKSSAGQTLEVETSTSKVDGDWKVTEFSEKEVGE